jgi:hypothetical protein
MAAYTTIDDPSAHYQNAIWTGDGNDGKQITNDGNSDLKPDLIWLKDRTQAECPAIFDSSRGASIRLQPNSTGVESTESATQQSFTTDGFTVGTSGSVNNGSNPDKYVAWQWKANGGTTSSNSDGSLASTVQANTDAGFSIVTYAGANSTNTVGHGLGVAPKVVIVRARNKDVPTSWVVFHKDGSTTDDDYWILNSTAAKNSQAGLWNNQYPSSTTFGIANDFWVSQSGFNYLAYCFAEVQGYSKFGIYVGNGTSGDDGTFIYTGFKPAMIMTKRSSSADAWVVYDNKRDTYNPEENALTWNACTAEADFVNWDFVSNGFKSRTGNSQGASGVTFIYMAFAENPFVTSTGIPATAR